MTATACTGLVLNEVVHKHSAGYYSNYKYKYKYKYDYQYRTEPSETESTETAAAEADAKHIEGEKQA